METARAARRAGGASARPHLYSRARARRRPCAAAGGCPARLATLTEAEIKNLNWDALQSAAESCRRCKLCEARRNVAFGVGDRKANIMFIGEGPGQEEDRQGIPFVGPAGRLLDAMLFAINLNRKHNVYIANIVKCRPPGNRNPAPDEARECLPYLRRQIALAQPRLLVLLGRVAASALLQTEEPIAALRQKLRDFNGVPLMVTYHPAYLLRNPLEKRKAWDDLRFLRSLIKEQS